MDDVINRKMAIDALGERPRLWTNCDYELGCANQYDLDRLAIETVPSAQPELPIKKKCTICPHCDNCDVNDDGTIAQPEPCDDPRADVYYLAEKIGIHRLYALVVELRGEPEQLERCPIYDGVCCYPSDQCYDCPRHHGAQTEQQWIPVTEKLPEDEYVLISKKPIKLSGSKWCVTVAIRMADPRSGKIQWRDSGFGIIQDDEVLAWMPLPKAWKEGEA